MAIFYVFQRGSFDAELKGGYIWSPQKTKNNRYNEGFSNMRLVKSGDLIFHHHDTKIVAISISRGSLVESPMPEGNFKYSEKIIEDGYLIRTDYLLLTNPLNMALHREWISNNFIEKSAFNKNGKGKMGYLFPLPEIYSQYIIEQILKTETNSEIRDLLTDSLSAYNIENIPDFSDDEINQISENLNIVEEKPSYSDHKEEQKFSEINKTKKIPKRSLIVSARALKIANYQCEVDSSHVSFLRNNGTNYTEPHHLIPISKYREFNGNSLDREQNIVSLCSNCHNQLHYGRFEDKKKVLSNLYSKRIDFLKKIDLNISIDTLESYYK